MVSENKQLQVQSLIDAIEQGKNFALIKFERTLHTSLEALRRELHTTKGHIQIVKNSLFIKALNKLSSKNKNYKIVRDQAATLKENTAVLLLGEEWNKGLNTFAKFTKTEKTLSFKLGLLDNTVYNSVDLAKISQLPGKNELIAKLLSTFKTPVSNFNYALKFNMQKFVYILSEKSKQTS